jgi:hypothetical protein
LTVGSFNRLGIERQCESGIAVAETDLGSLHVDLFHHQDRGVRAGRSWNPAPACPVEVIAGSHVLARLLEYLSGPPFGASKRKLS